MEIRAVLDSKAKDRYRGGAFSIEFEVAQDGRFGEKLSGRIRVSGLLDAAQRSAFLDIRNSIAARAERPPDDYLSSIPEFLREEYVRPFLPEATLDEQFLMRFRTPEDVAAWCVLLRREMPTLIERASTMAESRLYLGSDSDW
jgi:hypothetical protein